MRWAARRLLLPRSFLRSVVGNKVAEAEWRYYISSREMTAADLAKSARAHRAVENRLHWVLDVTFGEDASQIREDHAPQNFSLLKKIALNMLRMDTTGKAKTSLRQKRKLAAWDDDVRANIYGNPSAMTLVCDGSVAGAGNGFCRFRHSSAAAKSRIKAGGRSKRGKEGGRRAALIGRRAPPLRPPNQINLKGIAPQEMRRTYPQLRLWRTAKAPGKIQRAQMGSLNVRRQVSPSKTFLRPPPALPAPPAIRPHRRSRSACRLRVPARGYSAGARR